MARGNNRRARLATDALLEQYVSWREESEFVRLAYERWDHAEQSDSKLAYAAYLAALDREEHAAQTYADQVGSVSLICSQ
jgi:hypothetical protein